MAGMVSTISPRVPIDDYERMARRRAARDGSVTFTARSGDRRQAAHLDRLYRRLAANPDLQLDGGTGEADGVVYLSVTTPGRRAIGWWGRPK